MVFSTREQYLRELERQQTFDYENPNYELYKQFFGHKVPSSIKAIYELKSRLDKGVHNHNYIWVQYFLPLNLSAIQASSIYKKEFYCFGVEEDGYALLINVQKGQQDEAIYIDYAVGNGKDRDIQETELQLINLLDEIRHNG